MIKRALDLLISSCWETALFSGGYQMNSFDTNTTQVRISDWSIKEHMHILTKLVAVAGE